MRRVIHFAPLIICAAIAVALAIPLISGHNPQELPSALIDQPAPDFDLPPLPDRDNGFARADLGGEVMLVNVFASWCIPCLAEHPIITRLSDDMPVMGINHRDEPDDALAWLARHGDPYDRIGVDLDGRASIDWGVYGVPETFLIDAQGRIRYRHAGPITPEILRDELLPLIAEVRE